MRELCEEEQQQDSQQHPGRPVCLFLLLDEFATLVVLLARGLPGAQLFPPFFRVDERADQPQTEDRQRYTGYYLNNYTVHPEIEIAQKVIIRAT